MSAYLCIFFKQIKITNIKLIFQGTGTFIEIGAFDGEFMSLTLWLEQKRGFKGLLLEPNPRDYKLLLNKRRSSYSINACASPDSNSKKVGFLFVPL